MTNSWKRRVSRGLSTLLLASALFGVALLSPFRPAEAATTCAAAVSEAGGSHKRCTSSTGVFHVWTPPGYSVATTGYVVVYVHGWSDQCAKPSSQDSNDGVPDTWFNTPGAVYIDAAWTSHNLATQFSGSGLSNAVFVAIQAPTCSASIAAKDPAHVDTTVRWRNFDDLLTELQQAGFGAFNVPIVLIGHSGAYVHLDEWENDNAKINHVIHLDTFYGSTGRAPVSNFRTWLKNANHTSSIIATSETNTQSKSVIGTLSDAKSLASIPGALDDTSKRARVLYIESNVTHMQIVTQGRVIPMLLSRVPTAGTAAPAAPTPPAPTSGGTTGTSGSQPTVPPTEMAPVLEIPIPNLNFTGIIRENGNITIPWLAQYIGGVYTFLLSIAGLMAAVMMVIGGFQYVTSAGDKGKLAAGKKKIVDALTGLVLALSSYVILFTINPDLVAFNGLQLLGVQTVPLAEYADGASVPPPPKPGDPVLPAGTPPPPPAPGSNQRTCNSVATCLPYCRAANCTKVLCYKGDANCPPTDLAGFEGVSLSGTTAPTASDCVQSKFPNIPPGAPVGAITWDGIHNIKPNGQRASQLVIDGLKRAEKYIDDNYAGQDLKISLSNCFRDTRLDFAWQCTEIMRPPPKNNPEGWGSTWPGSNPHSSGYACDLALTKGGKIISGNIGNQNCTSIIPGNKLLVDILTNATVGGRRLGFEAWHFNWGGFNSCYCAGSACPVSPIIGDCFKNHENTKC